MSEPKAQAHVPELPRLTLSFVQPVITHRDRRASSKKSGEPSSRSQATAPGGDPVRARDPAARSAAAGNGDAAAAVWFDDEYVEAVSDEEAQDAAAAAAAASSARGARPALLAFKPSPVLPAYPVRPSAELPRMAAPITISSVRERTASDDGAMSGANGLPVE